jgi:hypothetical protein
MGSSGPGRVRVERGIYRQPNGKYAVCWRHAGRLRFRTVGFDVAAARRAPLALIAATSVPISPRLRFETVAGWWVERLRGEARRRRAPPAHARGAPLPARPPPDTRARAPAGGSPSTTSPSSCSSRGARAGRPRPRRARWRRCRACCASRAAAVGSSPTRSSCSSTTSAPGSSAAASACSAVLRSSACSRPAGRGTG